MKRISLQQNSLISLAFLYTRIHSQVASSRLIESEGSETTVVLYLLEAETPEL